MPQTRPLAVLAAAAAVLAAQAAAAQPAGPTVIPVQLFEYHFSPDEIDLVHGQAYVLRVTNTGSKAHDLSAKAFFRTVSVAPDDAAEVRDGAVELAPGESADVAFVAGAPGRYEMHCTHPLHSMLGMNGKIVVR
ncbi:MAG TPA: cupredoxin domain-containing protein [Caulobacteraceae bacterium]|jgi:uncharacterized cupredoxin-like copper-binding protein|nr:cupredoxin domain-containing protein [Caulobacteraceae bacterium]